MTENYVSTKNTHIGANRSFSEFSFDSKNRLGNVESINLQAPSTEGFERLRYSCFVV